MNEALLNLERAIWRRDYVKAVDLLHALLRRLAGGKFPPLDPELTTSTPADRAIICSRIACALFSLFADPKFVVTAETFIRLTPFGPAITNIFAISGVRSADFILDAIAAATDTPEGELPAGAARLKYLVLWSLDSRREHPTEKLFEIDQRLRLPLLIKLLYSKPVSSQHAQRRREELLSKHDSLDLGTLPRGDLEGMVALSSAFMLCSYASGRDKHRVKSRLNAVMRDWLLANGYRDTPGVEARRASGKATMVVAAEVMSSVHVQYRFFGQWLRQLHRHFRLVLLTEAKEVDDVNRQLFDAVRSFTRKADGSHLREAIEAIEAEQPSFLFYPSVGMRHWGVALSNLRLAPIQATALGHSASTFCPTIDYYVIEEGYVGDPQLFSETVALLPDSAIRFERSPLAEQLAPAIRPRALTLRIAVPSNALKLNYPYLKTLQSIAKASPRPLEFHFFPNVGTLETDAVRAAVSAVVPRATVWGALGYMKYLTQLNACDLTLSPFPFGGLHSVIDSLRQGLPVLAQQGDEPHSRTDALMLRLAGMPDWLIAGSEREFVDAALRIIGDDALRVRLSDQAVACDVANKLFGDASTPLGTEIGETFLRLYENHAAIRASGLKAVRLGDMPLAPVAEQSS
jgi:HMW1C N-terminal